MLATATVALAGTDCARGSWRWRADAADGVRDYEGRSTSGRPVGTRSDLRHWGIETQWLPWGGHGWALGTRLQAQHTTRHIRSTAQAAGYPERHRHWQAAIVGAAQGAGAGAFASWRWQLEAAAGGGPKGRIRADLPGYDVARLRGGRSLSWQTRLQLEHDAGVFGHWHLALEHGDHRFAAGPPTALTRLGQVVGGVSQPATRVTASRLTIGFTWPLGR